MRGGPAKSPADQLDVDPYIVGVEPDRLRRRVAHILRNLGGSPDLALGTLKKRGGVTRFHGSMRHEWQLVRGLDEASGKPSNTSYRIKWHSFLRGCLPKRVHDRGCIQVLVGTFVPVNLKETPPFHRTPHSVGDNCYRRIGELAYITDTGNLL